MLKPGTAPPDPEESEVRKVLWHVDESNLKINMPGPYLYSSVEELVDTDLGTYKNSCNLSDCEYRRTKTTESTTATGLEELSGTYAFSLIDRITKAKVPVAGFQAAIASGDVCEILKLQKLLIAWCVPGVDVSIAASFAVDSRNTNGCFIGTKSKSTTVNTKAFFLTITDAPPVGTPMLFAMGIYVRAWPFYSLGYDYPNGIFPGSDGIPVVNELIAPAWIGISPGNGGANANILTQPQADFFESYILNEETVHFPAANFNGGSGLALTGDGMACLDTGETVNLDLSRPYRAWSAKSVPFVFQTVQIQAVECCKPSTCEIDLALPGTPADLLLTCEIPLAPNVRPPVNQPKHEVQMRPKKRITVSEAADPLAALRVLKKITIAADGFADVTYTVLNAGPCVTGLTTEDRMPAGLGNPIDITNSHGPTLYDSVERRLEAGTLPTTPLCVGMVMTVSYRAEILDADDIYDWVQVTSVGIPMPNAIPNNLPDVVNPADPRESDEAIAVLDGAIDVDLIPNCDPLCKGIATVTITILNDGECVSGVTIEDRIPDGLGDPTNVTNDRGTATFIPNGRTIHAESGIHALNPSGDDRLCVNDIMTITYQAVILDRDDILDWVQITVQGFEDPNSTPGNLPPDPDDNPNCREDDEAKAVINGSIYGPPENVDCTLECLPLETDCEPMQCIEGFNMSGPIPLRDGRAVGCCLSTRAFEDLGGFPAVDCNTDFYNDFGSVCYTPLFWSKTCTESRIRLDARTYLKFKPWDGT